MRDQGRGGVRGAGIQIRSGETVLLERPSIVGQALSGTPEQIAERLQDMSARGLGYAIHYFPEAAYDRSGIELFEREVIPALS